MLWMWGCLGKKEISILYHLFYAFSASRCSDPSVDNVLMHSKQSGRQLLNQNLYLRKKRKRAEERERGGSSHMEGWPKGDSAGTGRVTVSTQLVLIFHSTDEYHLKRGSDVVMSRSVLIVSERNWGSLLHSHKTSACVSHWALVVLF